MNHRLFLACALAFWIGGCQVDEQKFQQQLFSCNPSAADPGCGTDRANQPMVCVAAHQLGGPNFCAESCDRSTAAPDGDGSGICLAAGPKNAARLSGARLATCDPSAGDNACGHPELSCLRTDLLSNEGVCMTLTPCTTGSDCRDPVRGVCMGELLRQNYTQAPLKADHTYCVQAGCRARRTACSPGETCLRDVIPPESKPSDICVPNCDANHNCPPNYFCYTELYSRVSPAVCIPGLLGLRCRNKMDCLLGECADTGAGFNVCTVSCQDDSDCSKYDSEHGTLFCNEQKKCAGPRAFRGALCEVDGDCRTGEICSRMTADGRTGICLFPCGANGNCPAYGGVGHACLPQAGKPDGAPVCWPGALDVPCRADDNCAKGLQCRPTVTGRPNICSTVCLEDADCQRTPMAREGWCMPGLNLCRAPLKEDAPCERDAQCESRRCITRAGAKVCDKLPGY